ncbi:T cell receptor alpha variable 36/delta variable 7 [Chaetodon auriga]|uniref:T cell receptor alpha variable 36/delta variable 7 n=1 Tax=Chaetodon auriga TaxID=39042 RepID=UPI004032EA9E
MFMFQTGSSEDLVKPFKDVMLALEGDNVTLSCKYSGSVNGLYWYQQKSSSSPQFLISGYSDKTAKLSVKEDKTKKEFHLQISSAAVTDSALYYCALQPTVLLQLQLLLLQLVVLLLLHTIHCYHVHIVPYTIMCIYTHTHTHTHTHTLYYFIISYIFIIVI